MSPRNLSLTRAVSDGDAEAVRALLAEGADANRATSGGQTPLILAIVFRHAHILPLLLAAGADPQLRDSLGLNAIDWAERRGFTEGASLLAQSQSAKPDIPSVHSTDPMVPNPSVSRSVETPVTKTPEQLTRADEKTRQWLAGIKRRFDEEAGRKAKEELPAPPQPPQPPTEKKTSPGVEAPRVPVNDSPIRAATTPPDPPVIPEKVIVTRAPDSLTNLAPAPPQPLQPPTEKKTSPGVEAPRVPVNNSPIRAATTPPEPPVIPEKVIIARAPDSLTNVAPGPPSGQRAGSDGAYTSQPRAGVISPETSSAEAMTPGTESERKPQRPSSMIDPWPKSSQRKRCPKCNAVYNSELIAYCAVDMTPLVDANLPVGVSPQATTPPLIWMLVGAAFIASAVFTYLISGYLSKVERVSTPATAPPPQAAVVKKAMPVVGGELAGKALTLPEPEYPPTARSEGVEGTILVRVKVDQKGRVISARSFEGDWRLRAEAIKAATRATF